MSILSCKSKTESALDDMDSFVTRWEHKLASGSISKEDKQAFSKEVTELDVKYKDLQSQAATMTPQEQTRAMDLGQRMSALMLNNALSDH